MEIPGYYYDEEKKKYFKIPKRSDPLLQTMALDAVKTGAQQAKAKRAKKDHKKPEIHDMDVEKATQRVEKSISMLIRQREYGHILPCRFKGFVLEKQTRFVCTRPLMTLRHAASIIRSNPRRQILWGQLDGRIGSCEASASEDNICFLSSANTSKVVSLSFPANLQKRVLCCGFFGSEQSAGMCHLMDEHLSTLGSFSLYSSSIWCSEWTLDSNRILIGGSRRFVSLNAERMKKQLMITMPSDVFSILPNSQINANLCGCRDGRLRLTDERTRYYSDPIFDARASIFRTLQTKSPHSVAIVCGDGLIRAVDIRTGRSYQSLQGLPSPMYGCDAVCDDNHDVIIAGSHDGIVRVWSLQRSDPFHNIDVGAPVQSVCFGVVNNGHLQTNPTSALYIASGGIISAYSIPYGPEA